MTARTEDTIALSQALCTQPDGPRSRVTMGVNTKISDSIKWGPDTYDKINYTVEIFATVSVECDQANDSIREAQNIAYDLAWDASRRSIQNAVVGHYEDIRNRLFSGYFPVK